MAKKSVATAKRIGESDVKSLDGLTFGTKDQLPSRQQTIDPARVAAAVSLADQLEAGNVAGDSKTYKTFHDAHLAMMVYRRLLVLGIERAGRSAMQAPRSRITQVAAGSGDGFRWSLWSVARTGNEPPEPTEEPSAE